MPDPIELPPLKPAEPSKELLPVQPAGGPAGGGWAPKPGTIVALSVFMGAAGAVVPVLASPDPLNWRMLVAMALSGTVTALGSYLGLRSAGSRQP